LESIEHSKAQTCERVAKPRTIAGLAIIASTFGILFLSTDANSQSSGETEDPKKAIIRMLKEAGTKGNPHFCQIILNQPGLLRSSVDNMKLSSKANGGSSARAQILASNSSYNISIDEASGFTMAPVGGNDQTTFRSSVIGYGASTFAETPGTIPTRMKRGQTDLEIDLVAERISEPFPAGEYSAELTLRCE
jgi:hypothetical protein